MKTSLFTLLVVAAVLLCTPAFADSYAFVNFDELQGESALYPFASFYGGIVQSAGPGNNVFAACYAGFTEPPTDFPCAGRDFITIYTDPSSFPVHEVSFDLSTLGPYDPDLSIVATCDLGHPVYQSGISKNGSYHIDIVSPVSIMLVSLYDPSFQAYYTIDNVAFNPSLAPAAATPEPSSFVLILTALLGSVLFRWRKGLSDTVCPHQP